MVYVESSEIKNVRFTLLKRMIASVLTHPSAGKIIAWLFQDRIPSRDCLFDTSDAINPHIKAKLFWGMYESAEVRFIRKYLRSDLDVIELGSGFGVVSCQIVRKMHGGRLICIEANPEMLQLLRVNLDLNKTNVPTEIIHAAISSNGEPNAKFYLCKNHLVSSLDCVNDDVREIQVPTARLSYVIERFKVNEYVLVSDIEGAEADIFINDNRALERCRQMVIELHDTKEGAQSINIDQLAEMAVREFGFHLRARRGPVCVFDK